MHSGLPLGLPVNVVIQSKFWLDRNISMSHETLHVFLRFGIRVQLLGIDCSSESRVMTFKFYKEVPLRLPQFSDEDVMYLDTASSETPITIYSKTYLKL